MKNNNFILLAGRPGAGKTAMAISYANTFSQNTLYISQEKTAEELYAAGLDSGVRVMTEIYIEEIKKSKATTIIVDYAELFEPEEIQKLMNFCQAHEIRLVMLCMMRRDGKIKAGFAEIIF